MGSLFGFVWYALDLHNVVSRILTGSLQTFFGTASHLGHKLVLLEVCVRQGQHWEMWTVDIRKALFKGISYSELATETGEPLRVVNFELDPESVEVLRKFHDYEDFDPTTEVLSNIRPGTGNVDAPRCFGMKLDQAFKKFGASSCVHDRHIRVRSSASSLIKHTTAQNKHSTSDDAEFSSRDLPNDIDFICSDHVDDIKVGCCEGTFLEFKQCFEKMFGNGELEITRANFTNCGIQHKRTNSGYELSQHTYISRLNPSEM